MSKTSIAVAAKTRDELRALKTGGQTYDDVLQELLEHYEKETLSG
jgi:predicted CopG family antitoxin